MQEEFKEIQYTTSKIIHFYNLATPKKRIVKIVTNLHKVLLQTVKYGVIVEYASKLMVTGTPI